MLPDSRQPLCRVSNAPASWCHQQGVRGSKKLNSNHSMLQSDLKCCSQLGITRLTKTCDLQGMRTSAKQECQHTAYRGEAAHIWVWCPTLAQCCAALYRWIAGAEPLLDGKRGRSPSQVLPWSVFSPKFPHSQKASPNECFFPRDARRQSGSGRWKEVLDCTGTHGMETSQAMQGHQPAPAPLPRLERLSLLPRFSAGRYGRRQKGHFTGSVNKSFYLCVLADSCAPSLKPHQCLQPCLQALR